MSPRKLSYTRESLIEAYEAERLLCGVAFGECFCRCGGKTAIAKYSRAARGWVAGMPKRCLPNHYSFRDRPAISQPIDPTIKAIPLTKGQVAFISAHRYEEYARFKWQAYWSDYGYYAVRAYKRKDGTRGTLWMHRQILGLDEGDLRTADHIKSNETLNNTDGNLRIAPSREKQMQNRRKPVTNNSGYKGVHSVHRKTKVKFRVVIGVNGKRINLGYCDSAEIGARIYDRAALIYHGEFALLNFPRSDYDLRIEYG